MKNLTIIMIFLCLIFKPTYALVLPKDVKIGLFYSNSTKNHVKLKSNNGFRLGYYINRDFVNLFDVPEHQLILRKDGYFAHNGSEVIEIEENAKKYPNTYGPWHIEYCSNVSIGKALKTIEEYKKLGVDCYIACIGLSINVWGKSFLNYNDALWESKNGIIKSKVCALSGKRTVVLNPETDKILYLFGDNEHGMGIAPTSGTFSIISGKSINYRGALEIKRIFDFGNLTIINVLEIEDYLKGVLNREVLSHWPTESLKIQALISRTYCLRNLNKHKFEGFDLCNTEDCQMYTGTDYERSSSNSAIQNTTGEVITYKNNLICSPFCSCVGKCTEDAVNVWGYHYPYLMSVESHENESDKNWINWEFELPAKKASEILKNNGHNLGEISGIEATSYSTQGRVLELKITGERGTITYKKEGARSVFSNYTPSQMFKISKKNENGELIFIFSGAGRGHGVGLSQYGAKNMAEMGMSYVEILKHFYKGSEITKLNK